MKDNEEIPTYLLKSFFKDKTVKRNFNSFIYSIKKKWKELHPDIDIDINDVFIKKGVSLCEDEKEKPIRFINRSSVEFNVPNAKIDEEYSEKIKCSETISVVNIISIFNLPEDVGLFFDEKSSMLSGIPKKSGEYSFFVVWENRDKNMKTKKCKITIIPNPRSLWKTVNPDKKSLYFKENSDSKKIEQGEYTILASSKRGRSHAHKGTFREDDFFIEKTESNWNILIVCDGAGSAKYSREGS